MLQLSNYFLQRYLPVSVQTMSVFVCGKGGGRGPVKSAPAQVKSSTVKSAPNQNGLKMKVKSVTYFK